MIAVEAHAGRCERRSTPRCETRAHARGDGGGRSAGDRRGHARSRCWSSGRARAVARHARQMLGGIYGRRVVVVCGKGNNGADGRVAARRLRARGCRRRRVAARPPASARPSCAGRCARADLVIDAMYGTGFRGRLEGPAEMVATRDRRAPVCAFSRSTSPRASTDRRVRSSGAAVRATETICFAAYKPGLLFEPGRAHAGRVRVVDIGIDDLDALGRVRSSRSSTSGISSLPQPARESHKWSSGCLVVGGSGGMVGAPVLASQAALRCGAGMVVCAVPAPRRPRRSRVASSCRARCRRRRSARSPRTPPATVLKEVDRFRALVVGPGLGREPSAQAAGAPDRRGGEHRRRDRRRRAQRDRRRSRGAARAARGRAPDRGAHAPRGRVRTARGPTRRRRPRRGRARARAATRRRSCC